MQDESDATGCIGCHRAKLVFASVCRLRARHRAAASAKRSGNQERDTTVSQPAINRSWATTKAL